MSEIYTILCENVAVSAAQDILSVTASSSNKVQILAIELAANGQTTIGNYPIRLRYVYGTITAGSGGASVTGKNVNPSNAGSASFSAARNNTTEMTGTTYDLLATQFNPINGYYWTPPVPQGEEPKTAVSAAFALTLDNVTGTLNISATMWLREI